MRCGGQLQRVDLTKTEVKLPQESAAAIDTMREDMADNLGKMDLTTGGRRPTA